MRKLLRPTLLAALAAALLAVPAAPADEKKDTKDKEAPKVEKTEAHLAAQSMITAYQLADFGRRTKTAEALATAALMIAKTPFADVELPKEKQEGVVVKKYDPKAEANALLAEAKKLDPKGKAVAEIAEKVSDLHRERSRSPVGGLKTTTVTIAQPGQGITLNAAYPANLTQNQYIIVVCPTTFPNPVVTLRDAMDTIVPLTLHTNPYDSGRQALWYAFTPPIPTSVRLRVTNQTTLAQWRKSGMAPYTIIVTFY